MKKIFTYKTLASWLIVVISMQNLCALDLRSDSVDILHTHLSLDFSNFSSRILQARADIDFKSKVNNLQYVRLDLLKLNVDSVWWNGVPVNFTYNDSFLTALLPSPIASQQSSRLSIFYGGRPFQDPADFGGFYWTQQYAFNIGVSFLSDPHNYGRVWFPCFDNFTERSTFSYAIITDAGRSAVSNGSLDSMKIAQNGNKIWFWNMKEPIPSYLACVAVSDYQSLVDTINGKQGIKPVLLSARASDTTNLKNSFTNLKKAYHIYEELFGPYEFNKVGYSVVPFSAGAMEHASNIAYMQAVVNGFTQYENLMAHELSHHWFGDLVTCDKAEEMWLNEGWATYCEALFYEKMYGTNRAKDFLRKNQEDVLRMAHIRDGSYWPVSGLPTKYAYSTQSVYENGSLKAHALRAYMGDSLFFRSLKNYFQAFKFKDVNSIKFRDYLISNSTVDLFSFFDNWIFTEGFPHFSILDKKVENRGADNYEVTLNIRQRLHQSPRFYANVPLEISFFDEFKNRIVQTIKVSGECSQHPFYLPFDPVYIALDFDEKIPDAITDEHKYVSNGINYDFGMAKALLSVKNIPDTSLVRVEHHWVSPDHIKQGPDGYRMSDYRYWTIDGVWSPFFQADMKLLYNGSTSLGNGYLDNTFMTLPEDRLAVLYRENQSSSWRIVDSFKIFPQSSLNDKIGYVWVYNISRGDYALALSDPNASNTIWQSACNALSVSNTTDSGYDFEVFPNPVNSSEINIEMSVENYFSRCKVVDFLGSEVVDKNIPRDTNYFSILMSGLSRGAYVITLSNSKGVSLSKKIIKQ